MQPKKILLLGATFNTDNLGVGALTAGALSVLTARYPDAQIFFLDYGRDTSVASIEIDGRKISVPLINMRFSWKLFLPNNIVYLLLLSFIGKALGRDRSGFLIKGNPWLKKIDDADMAVAVSGGDSFSDIYGLGRFFYVFLPQLLVTILGKRLFFLPQTVGPFKGRLSRALARFLMGRAEVIYCRETGGLKEISSLLKVKDNDPKVRFCYDMGFIIEAHKPRHAELPMAAPGLDGTKPLVGLNVSGLLLIGGYNKKNMFALKVDYEALIYKIVDYLIEAQQANVVLIPHVFGSHEESDTKAACSIYEKLKDTYPGRLFCIRGDYDQNEIKHVIGHCDFFIGSRMHACIAALSQAIPAVGIAYSPKFIGVLETVGTGHLVADPRRLTTEEILAVIDEAFAERQEIKAHLHKTMPVVKEQVFGLLSEVH